MREGCMYGCLDIGMRDVWPRGTSFYYFIFIIFIILFYFFINYIFYLFFNYFSLGWGEE